MYGGECSLHFSCVPSSLDRALAAEARIYPMTRSDLIAALASRFSHLTAKDAEIAVKEILDAIGNSLGHGGRVQIRGFGSFSVNYRPARNGRNPKSGETVSVPAKYVPYFVCSEQRLTPCLQKQIIYFLSPEFAGNEIIGA